MRSFIGIPLILLVIGLGVLYASYGEVDPCRVLAVERARRAETHSGLPIAESMERWSRIETSQLSTGECTSRILDSWGERLSHHFH